MTGRHVLGICLVGALLVSGCAIFGGKEKVATVQAPHVTTPSPTTPNVATETHAQTPTPEKRREMEALYQHGLAALEEGRSDEALRSWERVFKTLPDHPKIRKQLTREYLARGMDAFSSGDIDEAIKFWEKALRVDPQCEKAKGYLAHAREQRARTREIQSTSEKGTP